MKSNNLNRLYNRLEHYDFTHVIICEDINDSFGKLYEIVMCRYNECCPVKSKKMSYKDFLKPWITRDIKILIKKRQNLFLLFHNNKVSSQTYKRVRNYVSNKIRYEKNRYYGMKFDQFRGTVRACGVKLIISLNLITKIEKLK